MLCPKSETHFGINLMPVVAVILFLSVSYSYTHVPNFPAWCSVVCVILIAAPLILYGSFQTLKSGSVVSWRVQREANVERVLVKLTGLLACVVLAVFAYHLFDEYRQATYFGSLGLFYHLLPVIAVLSLIYFPFLDRRLTCPYDEYWHFGNFVLGRRNQVNIDAVKKLLLTWIVKFFFLPLMIAALLFYLSTFSGLGSETVFYGTGDLSLFFGGGHSYSPMKIFMACLGVLYFIDVLYAVVGYIFSLKLCGTEVRSVDVNFLGWVAALACYPPFFSITYGAYLGYGSKSAWLNFFPEYGVGFFIWGGVIFLLTLVYCLSTVAFGLRFSNLTNRGLISCGPYRFSKHPAYIAKNLSWWFMSVPFLVGEGWEAVRLCVLLLGVNAIYYLRAKCEEKHMSELKSYVKYSEYISQRGVLSCVTRVMTVVKVK